MPRPALHVHHRRIESVEAVVGGVRVLHMPSIGTVADGVVHAESL
jgi:hypothetical protein